jgi:trehalose 6-phosphate synthase/phosphatase
MNKSQLMDEYRRAGSRLLLLDYDGVLAPITQLPEQAFPRPDVLELLEKLAADKRNTCVIVSGRRHDTLEQWLGQLPLDFAAEHGAERKETGGEWVPAVPLASLAWKQEASAIMQPYVSTLEGTFVEEKPAAVGLHYRAVADQARASEAMDRLESELKLLAERYSLRVLHGKKVVEVIPGNVDKGTAARFWLDEKDWPFILAAGDDVTDELLFGAVPESAWSVKVGEGPTAARARVATQPEFIELLQSLVVL